MDSFLDFLNALFPQIDSDVLLLNAILSLLFLSISIVAFYIVITSRVGVWLSKKTSTTAQAVSYITTELFNNRSSQNSRREYAKSHLKSQLAKNIYISEFVKLQTNISGTLKEDLKTLFLELGLYEELISCLHGYDWHQKAQAISALSGMKLKQGHKHIIDFVTHYRVSLRYKAQVASIILTKKEAFEFLNRIQKPLTEWQQMQILTAADQVEEHLIPPFNQWFEHTEPSIVVLSIKLTAHFRQAWHTELIAKCFDPHPDISLQAILAIKTLEIYEARETLIANYHAFPFKHQLEIVSILSNIGTEDCFSFLKNIALTGKLPLQLNALESLIKLGYSASSLKIELQLTDARLNVALLVDHVIVNRNLLV